MIYFLNLIFLSFLSHANFFEDRLDELASPVTTSANTSLIAGSLLTGIFLIEGVPDTFGEDSLVKNKPLGSWAKVGDLGGQLWINATYVGINYGLNLLTENKIYKKRSVHMLKSSLYAATWTQLLKDVVREPRPNNPNSLKSFPSGHATHAFAFASVIATEHKWYWGVAAYSLASLVAISRVNDNAHRLHDVIAGATIGMSYGLGVYFLENKSPNEIKKISWTPTSDGIYINYFTKL